MRLLFTSSFAVILLLASVMADSQLSAAADSPPAGSDSKARPHAEIVWSQAFRGLRSSLSDYLEDKQKEWETTKPKSAAALGTVNNKLHQFYNGMLKYEPLQKTGEDLNQIVDNLLRPGDPPIKIVVLANPLNVKTEFVINGDQPPEMYVGLGTLAFSKDVNELAGVLAFQIAQLRTAYNQSLAQKLILTQYKFSKNLTSEISKDIEKLNRDKAAGKTIDEAHLTNLQQALNMSRMNDSYEQRAQIEKQALKQMRMGVDVSDATKQKILAAKDAIDRMIDAGYDPWGGLISRKKKAKTEVKPESIKEHFKKMFFVVDRKESINSELEFVQNYLLYVENKKIDLQNQPFKGETLNLRLNLLHALSTAAQTATLKGVGKYYFGLGGGVFGGYEAFRILNAGDSQPEPTKTTEKKESSGKLPGWVGGTVGGLVGSMYAALIEGAARGKIFGIKRKYQKYASRYRDHLKKERAIDDQIDALSEHPENANVEKLIDDFEKASLFRADGIDPDLQKLRARNLYLELHEAPLISMYRIVNATARKALKNDPAVQDLMKDYEERAKVALTNINPDADAPSNSKVKKLSKKLQKQDIFYDDFKLSDRNASVFSGAVNNDNNDQGAFSMQRFMYGFTSLASRYWVGKNTRSLIKFLDKYLDQPSITPEKKQAIIEKMIELRAIQYSGTGTMDAYFKLIEKYYPEKSFLKRPVNELIENKEKISKSHYLAALYYKIQNDLTPTELHAVLSELVSQAQYVQASKILLNHLNTYSEYKGKDAYSLAAEIIQKAPRDFGNPFYKRSITNAILAKSMMALTSEQKVALWSQLGSQFKNPASKAALDLPMMLIENQVLKTPKGQANDFDDFIEKLDILNETGAERSFLSDLLLQKISNQKLSMDNIEAILDRPEVWRAFSNPSGVTKSSVEKTIIKKYASLAEKYPAFSYDPKHSEKVQKIILANYSDLKPNATLQEKADLWESMAARGATGVTDGLFQEVFDQTKDPTAKRALADAAMKDHLLWSKPLLTHAYQVVNKDKYHPKYIQSESTQQRKDFIEKVENFPVGGTAEERKTATNELLSKFNTDYVFADDLEGTQKKDFLKRLGALASADGISEKTKTETLQYLKSRDQDLKTASETGIIEREFKTIFENFSDAGPALVDALDWLSRSLETDQKQTAYIKDKIMEVEGNKEDDLAYSVMNSLVESAVNWSQEEKWEAIRWLRGSSEPPPKIRALFPNVGTETVRRLYLTLPTVWRMAFINPLLNSAKHSMLYGRFKPVFYEQILNELLPSEKESAKISKELLSAFLFAVEKAGNAEKKMSVLSYLLANHSEGEANPGKVLRNVLESYGVVGVKLGQMMAASDLLPDDIRKELSDLRDGANPPKRYEIFEQLQKILALKHIDPHFKIKKLLGSASVKYAILVEDPQGKEHVIQIKREEADVALNKDLKQLDLMVDYLVGQNKKRYAFLKGLSGATKDAIIRELSLQRESDKTVIAKEQYESMQYPENVGINVPAKTALVESLPGKKTKVHFMRSSIFVEGKPITHYDKESQELMAKVILDTEHEIYFGDTDKKRHFDPDRHPGNVLLEQKGHQLEYQPIDWGQLLELKPSDRERIYKLMAASQMMEIAGPQKAFIRNLAEELGLKPESIGAIQKELLEFFPNQEKTSRSALGGYYYLLSVLENHGMEKKLINYDFIKGIYQLEAYEELLNGKEHLSPKATFGKKVEAVAKEMSEKAVPTQAEKIEFAARHPKAALAAKRNVEIYQSGKTEVRDLTEFLKLSPKAKKYFMDRADPKLANAEEFMLWMSRHLADQKAPVTARDRETISRWVRVPDLEHLSFEHISVPEFVKIATTATIQRKTVQTETKSRDMLETPRIPENRFGAVAETYGAELVNTIFWSIYDRDPLRAQAWLGEMLSFKKHLGFVTFAAAQNIWNNLVTRSIPMSLAKTRYFSEHGISMAAGMIASEIVTRLINGEKFDDVLASALSANNLKRIGVSTVVFMAASKAVNSASDLIARTPAMKEKICRSWYGRLGTQSLTFILADGIHKGIDPTLEDLGVLPPNPARKLGKDSEAMRNRINALLPAIYNDMDSGNVCAFLKDYYGFSDSKNMDQKVSRFFGSRGNAEISNYARFVNSVANSTDKEQKKWAVQQLDYLDQVDSKRSKFEDHAQLRNEEGIKAAITRCYGGAR